MISCKDQPAKRNWVAIKHRIRKIPADSTGFQPRGSAAVRGCGIQVCFSKLENKTPNTFRSSLVCRKHLVVRKRPEFPIEPPSHALLHLFPKHFRLSFRHPSRLASKISNSASGSKKQKLFLPFSFHRFLTALETRVILAVWICLRISCRCVALPRACRFDTKNLQRLIAFVSIQILRDGDQACFPPLYPCWKILRCHTYLRAGVRRISTSKLCSLSSRHLRPI